MPVNSRRMEYESNADDWQKIRDCLAGERAVKEKAETYLPAPPGMKRGATKLTSGEVPAFNGDDRYGFYLSFAEYPEIVAPALAGLQGMIHAKPPEIVLPTSMEYLRESATPDGDSLNELWELITRETLSTSRVCLLAEIAETTDDKLKLCAYVAESLINWRQRKKIEGGGLTLAVLEENESEDDPDDPYQLKHFKQWRELIIDPETGNYVVRLWREADGEPELQINENGDTETTPSLRGKAFEIIPLTIINSEDRGVEFSSPPILPMVRRALAIYRKTADYFRSLYIKCDPQVVLSGVEKNEVPEEIGGGKIWAFNAPDAKASYLDIDGQGIPLQRQSILDEYERFAAETGRLMQSAEPSKVESGEAIRRRQSMQQVTLKSLVVNTAEGLQQSLRQIGRLMGLDDGAIESIEVKPNLDFTEVAMTTSEILDLVMAKNQGLRISYQTMNEIMRRRGVPLKDDETEIELIADEGPALGLIGIGGPAIADEGEDS